MLARFRPRLTYANVMSTIAVFVAVSTGGAYAANTVFSTDIVDGEVKTPDIANLAVGGPQMKAQAVTTQKVKDNNLTGTDLVDNTLTGTDVLDNSLKGADIDESTIGKVPDADKVDGRDASELEGARAYGKMVASECQPTPGLCTVFRGKRVAYIVRVATGTYCVGVDGISAADPKSLAVVTPIGRNAWASQFGNASCVSTEFEILAGLDDDPSPSNAVSFSIVIP
jgi:hypothetical protein